MIAMCSFGSLCPSHCYLSNPSMLFSSAEDLGRDTNQFISLIVVHRIELHDSDGRIARISHACLQRSSFYS